MTRVALFVALSGWSAALAQPYDPPPSNFTAYWDVPAFKDFPYKGPDKATGVLFWSHGVAGQLPQYQYAPPEVIKDFARAGWDVVKIQRNYTHEHGWSTSGTKHVADLVERVKKARDQGYKYIIAAGQSYGGAISLEASARTDLLFGVIAFAPGHGSDACGTQAGFSSRRISDNLQRQLSDTITAIKSPRVSVLMADGDECQGFNEPSKLIKAALERTASHFLQFDATMPVRGHGAAGTGQFRAWYGKCLLAFLDPGQQPAAKETRCPNPSPVPSFLFDDGYKLPTPGEVEAKKLMGGWSGGFASAAAPASRSDICVAVEWQDNTRLTTLVAYGAGPEKKNSMVTVKREFVIEGGAFVHKGSNAYRMVLTPANDGSLGLSITSADGRNNWTGTLKRGC
jgi:dienelactone hydrolase